MQMIRLINVTKIIKEYKILLILIIKKILLSLFIINKGICMQKGFVKKYLYVG